MKNRLNIKRAFKTLVKNGDGRIFVQKLEYEYTTRYLVANAHAIITVTEADYEANKEFLQNVTEMDLTNVIRKGTENNPHKVKLTTVSIYCGNVLARVIKGVGTRRFCTVNEEYISMLQDAGCNMDNFVVNSGTPSIKSALVDVTIADNKIQWAYVVLPIMCDVVNVLEDVLE